MRSIIETACHASLPPGLVAAWRTLKSSIQERVAEERLKPYRNIHLACGRNVLEGWADVDLRGRSPIIRHDLTRPLPLLSDSIEFISCEHFIEHMIRKDALRLLIECRRSLREGGMIRLSKPDLRYFIDEYLNTRLTEWTDVGWMPSSPCALINEGLSLWGHRFVYDELDLTSLLEEAGFHSIRRQEWRHSPHSELRDLECRPFHGELIVEAAKQAGVQVQR